MHTLKCNRKVVRFVSRTDAVLPTANWAVGLDAGGIMIAGWTVPPGARVGHIARFAHPGTCFYYYPDDTRTAEFGYLLESSFDMVDMVRRHRYQL